MKEQRGITLITLSITFFVLLIVIGVVFTAGFGQKSQVKEAIDTAKTSFHDNVKDALLILQTSHTSKSEYREYLKNNNYMNSNDELDVSKLLEARDCEYGNGSNSLDVYVLNENLDLKYYDANGKVEDLGNIGATMEP